MKFKHATHGYRKTSGGQEAYQTAELSHQLRTI